MITHEEGLVGLKENIGAGLFVALFGDVAAEHTLLERSAAHLAVAVAGHFESTAQSIDRLDTHTVEAYTLLECLGIVLSTGIELADSLNQFSLWDAATIVTDAHAQSLIDGHLDAFASAHLELVNAVVHHLLE